MAADAHAKVSDDNVTVGVLGAVENVLGSEEWVKGGGERREKSLLEVSVDDVVLVEAVDSIKNRVDDGEDAVKELSASGEFQRKVIVCARLEALVKFDLGWI